MKTPRSLFIALFLSCAAAGLAPAQAAPVTEWRAEARILARIKAPVFPARKFAITDYGAVAGGTVDCTPALAKAILACYAAGGGHVVVPAGVFLTGAIHLLSNVDLHLEAGSTLLFKTDPAAYLPAVYTRWEGVECMNYSPFIYAFGQENIAVTGAGTLDGQASEENWWGWAHRQRNELKPRAAADSKALNEMGDRGVPVAQRVFGAGHFLRPNFIEPYRCRNVLIEGVTLHRSPMWEINPELCTNVIVRGLTILTYGPNNDGCDPESSRDVLIDRCSFTTGDDCIAIKSGRNDDGRRVNVPAENIIVRSCAMQDGHAGVAVGSEVSAGCRNVFVENCRMDSPHLARALRLKSNARRGGVIENIFMRNIEVGRVAEAVLTVDFLYEEGAKGPFPPTVRNVELEDVTSHSSPRVMWIKGFAGATIDDIRFRNCTFEGVETAEVLEHAGRIGFSNVTIIPAVPSAGMNSRPPPPQ